MRFFVQFSDKVTTMDLRTEEAATIDIFNMATIDDTEQIEAVIVVAIMEVVTMIDDEIFCTRCDHYVIMEYFLE